MGSRRDGPGFLTWRTGTSSEARLNTGCKLTETCLTAPYELGWRLTSLVGFHGAWGFSSAEKLVLKPGRQQSHRPKMKI